MLSGGTFPSSAPFHPSADPGNSGSDSPGVLNGPSSGAAGGSEGHGRLEQGWQQQQGGHQHLTPLDQRMFGMGGGPATMAMVSHLPHGQHAMGCHSPIHDTRMGAEARAPRTVSS
mmetsp:Transcript_4067/g.11617  ORF Transcript_4067/g.11617 Transcript_4067/m.11617 type:complete len:115 (-) Transcript_4067:46-390(-)|eukprot:358826-Chlamydomonas_euryale.AAC.8